MDTHEAPDPYKAPSAELAPAGAMHHGSGKFDIGQAWNEALENTKGNIALWLGGGVVYVLCSLLAAATIIGAFLVVPVLTWGSIAFFLRIARGQPTSVGDIFSGFRCYGQALGSMLLLFVLLTLISLAGQVVQLLGTFLGSEVLADVGSAVNIAWSIVVSIRFAFAMFYVVDRGMGAVDALRASWEVTGPQVLNVFLLLLLGYVLSIVGLLALVIGIVVTSVIYWFMVISAFRQVAGDPEPTEAV